MTLASFQSTVSGPRRSPALEFLPAISIVALSFLGIYKFGVLSILAGVLALGALWLILIKPAVATLTMVFLIYSNAAAVAVRSHHLPSLVAMGVFLLLFLPMLNYIVIRREEIRTDLVFWLMSAYFAILVASALFSRNPTESAETLKNFVLEGMVLYFLIINTVRSPDLLQKAVWMLPVTAVLLGTLTSYQWLTKTYEKSYGGFSMVESVQPNGELFRPTLDAGDSDEGVERLRAFGPVADPNFYGQIMAAALPFALVPVFSARSRRIRMLAAAACVPIAAGIVLSYSRGAALAVVIFAICMLFLRYFKLRHLLLFAALILVVFASIPEYRDRIVNLSSLQSREMREADPSVRARALILRSGIARFLEHPLLGVGPGQSPDYVGSYDQASEFSAVRGEPLHNTYLQQLVETGILGFSCFMAIVFLVVRNLLRSSRYWIRRQPEYAHLAAALMLGVIAFLSASLFLHMAFVSLRYYSLLLGLSGAAVLVYQMEIPAPSPARVASRSKT